MSGARNKDAGLLRIPYFFCLECQARREAIDEGDPFPVCAQCGHRCLESRHEYAASPKPPARTPVDPAPDERPPEARPRVQNNSPRRKQELTLAVLTQLVTDFPAAVDNPETTRAMFTGCFNPFVRELVNLMVIERVEWRAATGLLSKEFSLRYATWLEAFAAWAENPEGVPNFIEPEPTPHDDPLSAKEPGTHGDSGAP